MKAPYRLALPICLIATLCYSPVASQDLSSQIGATNADIKTLRAKLPGQSGADSDATKASLAKDYYKLGQLVSSYISALRSALETASDANLKSALTAQITTEQKLLDEIPSEIAQIVPNAASPIEAPTAVTVKNTPWTRAVVGFNLGASTARTPQSQVMAEIFTTGPLFGKKQRKECPTDKEIIDLNAKAAKPDSEVTQLERNILASHSHDVTAVASSAKVDSHFQALIQSCKNDPFQNIIWGWINPRISSLPSDTSYSLNSLNDPATLLGLQTGKANQIAQTFEFTGGFDIQLTRPGFADEDDATRPGRLGAYWTFAGGMSTPLYQNNAAPTVYGVTSAARLAYAIDPSLTNIAFVPQDRSKFYLQYYTGLRLKTFFGKGSALDTELFPGQFDFLIGQNEAITGASLHGLVYRIEGFYPLPFAKYVHVFGLILLHSHGPGNLQLPPVLGPVQTNITPADPSVFQKAVPPAPNSDFYRIGVGFDLLCLMQSSCRQSAGAPPKSNP